MIWNLGQLDDMEPRDNIIGYATYISPHDSL